MRLSILARCAVLMMAAGADGAAGGEGGGDTTDAVNAATANANKAASNANDAAASAARAAAEANAAAAAAEAPDPVAASIATARQWIESGEVTEHRAAEWLHANCPDAFKDEKDALAAISQ